MSEIMHRTQLLLEPAQYQALRVLAQQEQRSISEIVRAIIDQFLAENDQRIAPQPYYIAGPSSGLPGSNKTKPILKVSPFYLKN